MRTVLCGNLLVEILPDAGNRLHRRPGMLAPRFRWRAPSRDRPSCPALGRGRELHLIQAAIADGRPIEFHAPCGYGVSTLLRAAAGGGPGQGPPLLYLRAGPGSIEDLAERLVAAMYVPDRAAVPTNEECLQLLAQARAVVVLDDFLAGPDHLSYLLRILPGCCLVIGSPRPLLSDRGASRTLRGLAEAAAHELVGSELGRTLAATEREALIRLTAAVDGQPLHLRQAAALVRSGEYSFAALAAQAERDPRVLNQLSLDTLSDGQRRALAVLALAAGAFLPIELVRTMGDIAQIGESLTALREHGLADHHGDRFGLPTCKVGPYRRSLLGYIHLAAATREIANWFTLNDPTSTESLSAVDGAIGVLGFAAERGQWETVALLARLIEPTLTLAGRWQACHTVLAHGLSAAEALGDRTSEAFFSHQRGTLELCRNDLRAAQASLQHALHLRELTGDRNGAAVTRHNLGLLLPPPTPPLPPGRKPIWARSLALAALAFSVLTAGAGIATMAVSASHKAPPAHPAAGAAPLARPKATPGSTTSPAGPPAPATGQPGTSTPDPATSTRHPTTSGPASPPPRPQKPLSAQPAQIDFGTLDITPGTAASSRSVILTNPNDRAITVHSVTIAGSPVYTITDTNCTLHPVAPHSSCAVDLQFAPKGLGPTAAQIMLTQANGEGSTIPITGSGYTELNLTIDPSTLPPSVPPITVQDDHGLLTCHITCRVQVTSPQQTTLTLTATPNSTTPPTPTPSIWFAFDQWLGDCVPQQPGQPACTLHTAHDTNITAYFVQVSGPNAAGDHRDLGQP
jgi:hypothetical protein